MVYSKLMISTATFMLISGIFFVLCGPLMLPYLGGITWTDLAQPPLTARSAISFTRLFGVTLFTAGLIAWMARKLDRPEDQRSIGLAFFIGVLSLFLVALTQQIAVWTTTPGWVAVSVIAAFLFSFGYTLFVELGLTDYRPLAQSQDPEKLRQQWVRQLSETAAQQERNRLARDLHDSIKQQIFSINVSAAAAQERWTRDSIGARQALEDVRHSAREAMTEMEAMLQQLRPAPLENIGLVEALRKQAEAVQYRTGAYVTTEFSDLPDNDTLLPGTQEAIFRIAQEALNNIARHARAKNVHLRLYQQRDRENPVLWLKIEDDGSGFDTTQPCTGLGLTNINARAAEIGGRLHIESAPGEGSNLVVSIPISSPDVNKIRRKSYVFQAYTFIGIIIIGILNEYSARTNDLFVRFQVLTAMVMLLLPYTFHVQKEKGLLEKLRSTKNVPLKVSLGLTRDSYQTLFFAWTLLICTMNMNRWAMPPSIFTWSRSHFSILMFITLLGFIFRGTIPRIHRLMKELKEKLSAIDFQQSAEQMWRQTIITLMIAIPAVMILSWWTHRTQLLLFIPLSALYLGYAAWWRYKGYSKTAQGA
ncbi:MAG: sensor histidine kinase [Acidobacteria bacterium]|nr:sensor histidine kinase [Acidobacteriota bacterium]